MPQKKHIRFDWAIKRLLRQKANFGILEGFLSELLKEDIKIVEILESESNQETDNDKYNRVDILVKDKTGDLIIVEVQNTYAIDYFLRILYGVSKTIAEHIDLGQAYADVKRVISVNVVYFELGHGSDYVYKGTTNFIGIHDKKLLELTLAQKKFFEKGKVEELYPEIYIIKVNKFDDNAKDTLDEWIYFLKNSEIKKEFTAKGLKKADKVLTRANMSDVERREYQRFQEVLSDRASIAVTIDFEAELLAEKKAEAKIQKVIEEEARKAEKKAEAKIQKVIEEEARKAEAKIQKIIEEETRKREAKIELAIKAMIKNTDFTDDEIANALGLDIGQVQRARK